MACLKAKAMVKKQYLPAVKEGRWSDRQRKLLQTFLIRNCLYPRSLSDKHPLIEQLNNMASSGEKFCLKWNDYNTNITNSYHELRTSCDFSDVTLVCENNQEIEAHRIILSACSPFFNNMLKRNKHPHPLIYMRGLKAKDLEAIVDFIYQGEANIYQEALDNFLALAEELQLKGLTGVNNKEQVEKENPVLKNTTKARKPAPTLKGEYYDEGGKVENLVHEPWEQENFDNSSNKVEYPVSSLDDFGAMNSSKVSVQSTSELDEKITELMSRDERTKAWVCTMCGKNTRDKTNLSQHIEANHIDGVSHPCNACGKVSRSRHALAKHMYTNHKNNLFVSGLPMALQRTS